MGKPAKQAAEGADETAAGQGRTKLLRVAVVALVAAGGAAWFFLFSGRTAEAEAPVPGEVFTLEPVAVNLAGGGYLKIGVALQFTEDAVAEGEEPDGTKATDLIISQFSQAQPVDVAGAREALREALQQRIIEAYDGAVMGIYYTEFVTQ
ncbi:flagellar basal body-associated FliL family protein [Blastococcus sp. KM273128]|uniref:flagellar basal body-associated FliL family protein n=1 Tax=Blastococcus sp. KM273128 TaxID=2570314 RepID=UPI001F2A594B|nr:flagellar basal body-associated FliL family protein [Blastococcus sp. KM273128]MCF6744996.1 flagellar basal body-associated FliL family protein [Blastococcus sp. KM273128]